MSLAIANKENSLKKIAIASVFVFSMFAAGSAFAEEWTGVISDSKCGAKHAEKMNAECVETCVKGGASPVFVVDGKVYKLDDASKVTDHLGHKVTLVGTLDGDTIKIDSVKM